MAKAAEQSEMGPIKPTAGLDLVEISACSIFFVTSAKILQLRVLNMQYIIKI